MALLTHMKLTGQLEWMKLSIYVIRHKPGLSLEKKKSTYIAFFLKKIKSFPTI